MTKMKKILAVALCVLLLGSVFAGCSGKKAEQTTEITDETLLIAYTADNAPFFQIDEKGNASGFEADLIAKIFDSIKDDCKNYAYVKVEPGYRLGEETAYTDKDGKTYIAYMAVGGLQKNDGTNNEDYSFTNTVISNRVVTLVKKDSKIKDYSNLGGTKLAVVSKAAQNALADNAVIADRSAKTTTVYKTAQAAFTALYQDKADAVVIDEFDLRTLDFILDGKKQALSDWTTELNGQLDTVEYAFATAKYDRLKDDINEALLELMALEKICPLRGPLSDQPMLDLLFAIALPAIASALLFNVGASSGGTDVIALIVEKYTHIHNVAVALFLTDLFMVIAACFVFDLYTALYSFVGLTVKSLVIDAVLEKIKMCKAILIVCDDRKPICDFVMRKLVRGATYTPCFGAYTDKPHYIIYTTLTRREADQLQDFIHKQHLNAFMSMLSTTEVFGKGFNHA